MTKFILLEEAEILPGIYRKAGDVVMGLSRDVRIRLVTEGKAEPVDYRGLPEGYPRRDLLIAHEYYSVEQVEQATDKQLLAIDGIGEKRLQEIRQFNNNPTDEEE